MLLLTKLHGEVPSLAIEPCWRPCRVGSRHGRTNHHHHTHKRCPPHRCGWRCEVSHKVQMITKLVKSHVKKGGRLHAHTTLHSFPSGSSICVCVTMTTVCVLLSAVSVVTAVSTKAADPKPNVVILFVGEGVQHGQFRNLQS